MASRTLNFKYSYKKLELLKRDYSSFNENNFLNDFATLDFNYLNNDNDINHIYNKCFEDITNLVEKHVHPINCTKLFSIGEGRVKPREFFDLI